MPSARRPLPLFRKRRRPDRYGSLLVLILFDCGVIFVADSTQAGRWMSVVLMAVTVIVGLHTSAMFGVGMHVVQGAAVVGIVLAVVDAFVQNDRLLGALGILQAVLLAILVSAIFIRLIQHQRVHIQTLLGVICAYVLFGLIFAFLAYGVSNLDARQYFVQTANPDLSDFLYFSFVVLTTVGFGDLTPLNDGGKAMVAFEALLGQIFLVTVVARLVSLFGREPLVDVALAEAAAESAADAPPPDPPAVAAPTDSTD